MKVMEYGIIKNIRFVKPEIIKLLFNRGLCTGLLFVLLIVPLLAASQENITGIAINLEGTLMYYTAEKAGVHNLYASTKTQSGTWGEGISEDSFNEYIKGYVVKTPFLSYDGQTLYFSSNLPGAKGFDIFYSKKTGDSWTKPAPVPIINTEQDEMSPALAANNQTIYFTRYSPENSCYSIYTSKTENSGWSFPQILPAPVNAGCENHVNISPTGDVLLFSSDRLTEKKKKKYTVFYTILIGNNLWSPPTPVDEVVKEANEFSPAFDNQNDDIYLVKGGIDSLIHKIHFYNTPKQITPKSYTTLTGTVKTEEGKTMGLNITITDNYTGSVYGQSSSNPLNGEYAIVIPNDGIYTVNYAKKNGPQKFEVINTIHNYQAQIIKKDVIVVDRLALEVNVQDALSNRFIDADVQVYEKTKSAKVSKLKTGQYHITTPVFEGVEVEIYKENYVKEILNIKFDDYVEFPEMQYHVKLKPDLRSGEINVSDLSFNKGLNADVSVKNLNIKDDVVHISSPDTGKYVFGIRKDCKYSISVTLKNHLYFYAVWDVDASRISQVLNVKPVPLNEINKIPMFNLVFRKDDSRLLPEALGELDCVADIIKNHPEYKAVIFLYQLEYETELWQQRMRSIMDFMESNRIPKTQYKLEISLVDAEKLPDISFVAK
jgi:hypothetical protein